MYICIKFCINLRLKLFEYKVFLIKYLNHFDETLLSKMLNKKFIK